jgi:hypothetical protein
LLSLGALAKLALAIATGAKLSLVASVVK